MQRAAPLVNCRTASDTFVSYKCGDALSMWKLRTNLSPSVLIAKFVSVRGKGGTNFAI